MRYSILPCFALLCGCSSIIGLDAFQSGAADETASTSEATASGYTNSGNTGGFAGMGGGAGVGGSAGDGPSTGGSGEQATSSTGGAGGDFVPPFPCPDGLVLVPAAVPFCIQPFEVTRGAYNAWATVAEPLQDGACASNDSLTSSLGTCAGVYPPKDGEQNLPATCIDWCDAHAYCKDNGMSLCPTSRWQAACSHDGDHPFPYGDSYVANACNGGSGAPNVLMPGGSKPACEGGYKGVFDMVGNAWEYGADCSSGDNCNIHGGVYYASDDYMRCDRFGDYPRMVGAPHPGVGFRCCAELLPTPM